MDDRAVSADGTSGAAFTALPQGGQVALAPSSRSELLAHLSAAFDLAERARRKLGLDLGVAQVIRATRVALAGEGPSDTPVEALCIAAAHWACDIAEDENPLRARSRLQNAGDAELAKLAGPSVAEGLREALRSDETWIHFWDDELPAFAARQITADHVPSVDDVIEASAAMRDLVDAALREPGRARNVAETASALARQLAMPEEAQQSLAVAGIPAGHRAAERAAGDHGEALDPLRRGDGADAPAPRPGGAGSSSGSTGWATSCSGSRCTTNARTAVAIRRC